MTDSVLASIVERKRREVAGRLKGAGGDAPPASRSLAEALGRRGARFIMEVKRASPSGHKSGHDVETAARAYAPVADAISVLTDGPGFGGRLEDVASVRSRFDGPILAKDFIVDVRQVAEARRHGADAVLVMLSVLGDEEARAVLAEAGRLGMDAIVEVHDEGEMRRAAALGPAIIGINNRDLKTLEVDLAATERLAALAPPDCLLISESGISSRADVRRLAGKVDAFLVGSALMRADDIGEAARALIRGRVKICGLTNAADMAAAADMGATHAGLILVPDTPRALSLDRAAELGETCRERGLKLVAVFRDCEPKDVLRAAERLRPDVIQLHGSESDEAIAAIRSGVGWHVEIWAASAVAGGVPPDRPGADRLVFDTSRDGLCGGTGERFDWGSVKGHPRLAQSFLAGGITPCSAASAADFGAYGIDVGSGVEAAPGKKDPARLKAVFDALRPVCRTSVQCA